MRREDLSQAGYGRSRATADATLPCARRVPCVEADTKVEQTDGASDLARLCHTDVFIRGDEKRQWCSHRMCYGYLNSFTVGDAFLMPTIDEGTHNVIC